MSVVDTCDGGVTLAESGFVLRWHPESKSCVAFAPLDASRETGVDKWGIEAVFPTVSLFDVWLGRSTGFECEKVLFRLDGGGLAFQHVDGFYGGRFEGGDMVRFCSFINVRCIVSNRKG